MLQAFFSNQKGCRKSETIPSKQQICLDSPHKQPSSIISEIPLIWLALVASMYAELHAKTNFSFLEGASHPDELVRRAAELGYHALAITDRNSLAGVVRAHGAAKDVGLKLIVGAEITPADAPPAVPRNQIRQACAACRPAKERVESFASRCEGLAAHAFLKEVVPPRRAIVRMLLAVPILFIAFSVAQGKEIKFSAGMSRSDAVKILQEIADDVSPDLDVMDSGGGHPKRFCWELKDYDLVVWLYDVTNGKIWALGFWSKENFARPKTNLAMTTKKWLVASRSTLRNTPSRSTNSHSTFPTMRLIHPNMRNLANFFPA